ncbi:MAG: GAF domain-containing protein [Candidatus Eremiobacteraeota bacterium]|nr:GAF domain-containing protein [Candidatus Eremiobacteraeota bacterium]
MRAQEILQRIHQQAWDSESARLEHTLAALAQSLGAERACLLTASGDQHQYPAKAEFAFSRRIVDRVLDSEQPILCHDAVTDVNAPTSKSVLVRGVRSVMCLPLTVCQQKAVLYLDTTAASGAFSREDLATVQQVISAL